MKSFFKAILYLVSASVIIFVMSACGTKTTGPAPEVAIDLGMIYAGISMPFGRLS